MARTKKVVETATVEDKVIEEKATVKVVEEPLRDDDEIEVMSLIPNVSYKDKKTDDMYEWEEVGHIEYMTFGVLKDMWRSHKGYFKNLCLKPLDERVIKQFGIKKVFDQYEYLMNEESYTKKNIEKLCEIIAQVPNSMKYSVVMKIRELVENEKLSDISVIRTLEKKFDLDLTSML